jgi:hypothetical protein
MTLAIAAAFTWYFLFFTPATLDRPPATLDFQIKGAYDNMRYLSFEPFDINLVSSLETLRDIAADTSVPVIQRVKALNGINFAYVASNFDAATVYDVVFSKPPFSAYYVPSGTSTDPIHPNALGDTRALDRAMVKLNEFSNSLFPNHYALARMQVAQVFEYGRDVAANPSQKAILRQQYAVRLKQLTEAYDALPNLEDQEGYPFHLMLQLMYLQASSLSFIGRVESDESYLNRGEQLYLHVIQIAGDSLRSDPTNLWVKNQLEFARMFYVVNYWYVHERAGTQELLIAIADQLADDYDPELPLYSQYIPAHANGTAEPSVTLRVIADSSSKLKTVLEQSGWEF